MSVTVGTFDLKHTVTKFQDRHIKGAATQVIDCDFLVFLIGLIQTIGQSSSRWLIDDTLNFQSCNLTGVFGSLPLRIIKISWNSDDCLCNRTTQKGLGITLELT